MGSTPRGVLLFILLAAVIGASRYYPYRTPDDEGEVYYAQNDGYVNPHLDMSGNYVPGYYLPASGASRANPTYFPVGKQAVSYPGSSGGAAYFAPGTNAPMVPGSFYSPYFYPPSP